METRQDFDFEKKMEKTTKKDVKDDKIRRNWVLKKLDASRRTIGTIKE